MALKILSKISFWKGMSFFLVLRNIFIWIAIFSFLWSGIQVWQDTGDVGKGLEELGAKMFNPIYNFVEHSKNISETGLYVREGHTFFQSVWLWFVNLYKFIEPFFGIVFGYYLTLLIIRIPLRHTNAPLIIHGFTVLIYVLLNALYLHAATDVSLGFFEAIESFFDAIKQIFT